MIGEFREFSIQSLVTYYRKQLKRIRQHLDNNPDDWGKYQNDFNKEMDHLFSQIIDFEKRCLKNNSHNELYRVKEFFIKRLRKYFYFGDLPKWSINKPYGYAGDFKVIDAIYKNVSVSKGYDRLFDNYFLTSAISVAVRNRKDYFKREILTFLINNHSKKSIRIMNLASGPAREIKEILSDDRGLNERVCFDCYDMEKEAHNYAKDILKGHKNVSFKVMNALRIAAAKDVKETLPKKYDLIYSMGLFDYLNYKISVRLVRNLRNALNTNGVLLIADVRDRYFNPSVFNMEWACGWDLIYRSDEEFQQIFIDAGFKIEAISKQYEQQGIMQYLKAIK